MYPHGQIPTGTIMYQGINSDERKDRALVACWNELDQTISLSGLSCDYYTDGLSGIMAKALEGNDQAKVIYVERYGSPHV